MVNPWPARAISRPAAPTREENAAARSQIAECNCADIGSNGSTNDGIANDDIESQDDGTLEKRRSYLRYLRATSMLVLCGRLIFGLGNRTVGEVEGTSGQSRRALPRRLLRRVAANSKRDARPRHQGIWPG